MTYKLGLTGGIGSGKSTVAKILAELGAAIIDADAIVHELQAPGMPLVLEIAAAFGDHVVTPEGALDRQAVADIVFRDPDARARLGLLVHPPVIAEMMRRTAASVAAGDPMAVVDIPLLFEGAKKGQGAATVMEFDGTLLAWVPEAVQLERTVARDGCSPEEAQRRIDAQLDIDEKRAMADHVIDNSGTLEATERQVRELFERLTG